MVNPETAPVVTESTLSCPSCGHRQKESMPVNVCVFFFECGGCGVLLRPKKGDCCVFCSYGDVPCPSVQLGVCGLQD